MCGVCGVMQIHGKPLAHREALDRMNAALAHRGPDDAGAWHNDRVGLAMRRLQIIDIEGSRQPMSNEDGAIIVVFNGEIYNFQELRKELQNAGHTFRSAGDTEVLVHAYEAYGDAMLERLNGMFAFAIYDQRARRLLLARDRLGIKPLFYTFQHDTLIFASELSALMRSGLVADTIRPQSLDAYFEFLYVPAPDTIYENVYKLCPGESIVVEDGTWHLHRYWEPTFAPEPQWTLHTAAERFRELLDDAVRLQSISDVPLGAFLSGGMDSTTVVAALARAGNKPLKTFTVGFEDAEADELRFARRAAECFGTEHTEIVLSPDWIDILPQALAHFGEPFADSSALPTWLVSKVARQDVTVALSGDGGDELFAGYTWLHRTRKIVQWQSLPQPLRHIARAAVGALPRNPFGEKLRRFAADLSRPPHEIFRRRSSCFNAEQRMALFQPDVMNTFAAPVVDRFEEHALRGQALDGDHWMLHQDTAMYLPDDVLTKVDRMSMAHSLEVRVPLLDHRIVEFAGSLPFHLKFHGGVSKRVMKEAMRDMLPSSLLVQRKRGFAIPIHRWFRGLLREHVEDVLLCDGAQCHAWIRPDYARALLAEHVDGRENHGHRLWALLALEYWLRGTARANST